MFRFAERHKRSGIVPVRGLAQHATRVRNLSFVRQRDAFADFFWANFTIAAILAVIQKLDFVFAVAFVRSEAHWAYTRTGRTPPAFSNERRLRRVTQPLALGVGSFVIGLVHDAVRVPQASSHGNLRRRPSRELSPGFGQVLRCV